MLDGIFNGIFGNLMEHNAVGPLWVELQYFAKVPSNSFSFAVFIGCQPDGFGFFDCFAELGDRFLFISINFVDSLKIAVGINWWCAVFGLFGDSSNMANTTEYLEIFSEVLFNGLGLCGALYNY